MKKLFLTSCIIVFLFLSFAYAGFFGSVKGNGILETKEWTLPPFEGLSVSGAWDVQVQCGKEQKVAISTDENLMSYIVIEIKKGILEIRTLKSINPKSKNEINISVKNLNPYLLPVLSI
jgi:hypothetical protein